MNFIRKKHILSTATLLLTTAAADTAMAANNVDAKTYPDVLVTGNDNTVQKNGSYAGPRHLTFSQQIYGQTNSVLGSTQVDVIGDNNIIKDSDVTIVGQSNKVDSLYGASVGDANILKGQLSDKGGWNGQINNVGNGNKITNTSADATVNNFGSENTINATGASSLGNFQYVDADRSVTLGDYSKNSRYNTVSVGAPGAERQIINVAEASEKTDAVNLNQMSVADAATLRSANDHTNDTAVQYDANKAGTSVTLKAADGTQIKNLAAGTEGMDAVNLDQMRASASNTLRQANIYTDGRITDLGNRMNKGLAALDGKIDDAQRHAYAGVAGAIAMSSIPQASPGHSSIGAGFGHFAGQQAAAFGYSHHWILDSHRGVIVKAAGMVTNQRDGGAMLGVGYEW